MAMDRDLEARVSCASTLEKKGSNARGCNTEDNLVLGEKMIAKGIIEVCFASASRPMKKKDLPKTGGDGRSDLLKRQHADQG